MEVRGESILSRTVLVPFSYRRKVDGHRMACGRPKITKVHVTKRSYEYQGCIVGIPSNRVVWCTMACRAICAESPGHGRTMMMLYQSQPLVQR